MAESVPVDTPAEPATPAPAPAPDAAPAVRLTWKQKFLAVFVQGRL